VMYVAFSFAKHGKWAKDLIDPIFCEDTKGIVAEKEGEPVGAILLDQWTKTSVQCHVGVENIMCLRNLQYEVADYVFNTCGRELLIGLTPSNNEKAIRINKTFGFKEHTRIKDAFDIGVDYIVYLMTKADCRFLREDKHGTA